ncbi:hypothetical protein SAMN04488040_3000 [Sulfitobacter marinus]|uniref:Uncharacterized protein n=1 Tax=Sulfitobacter marinus TaxID=394264 RepID=A0A1I6V0Z5_9RHOB|nr:hypothetical protein [Sulfitobacter marinus]SFT07266.1 hypothetical protein SAMN04488040_3000 [Sulfitobacter marinus]
MTGEQKVVLILGSGPNVTASQNWPAAWFDHIVAMNNAWRVRPDWTALVYPEDFPADRMPDRVSSDQCLIGARAFVPAQNGFGGFVYAGGTMAFTTGYWALSALRPTVLAFMGCDMVYPKSGDTHFYGTGTADPLRDDITLRDLGAKSARLALVAARQGCSCVNLSQDPSALLFPRAKPESLRNRRVSLDLDRARYAALRAKEDALGYHTPTGRYWEDMRHVDPNAVAVLDQGWRDLFVRHAAQM